MGKAMTSIAAALFLFLSLRPADPPPLLPRALILESSERGNPRLSPDGKRVAYCALHDGVENV
jgi:Tol biopolymer transport system component